MLNASFWHSHRSSIGQNNFFFASNYTKKTCFKEFSDHGYTPLKHVNVRTVLNVNVDWKKKKSGTSHLVFFLHDTMFIHSLNFWLLFFSFSLMYIQVFFPYFIRSSLFFGFCFVLMFLYLCWFLPLHAVTMCSSVFFSKVVVSCCLDARYCYNAQCMTRDATTSNNSKQP